MQIPSFRLVLKSHSGLCLTLIYLPLDGLVALLVAPKTPRLKPVFSHL